MQIYCYDPQRSESLEDAVREGHGVAALAVLYEVRRPDHNTLAGRNGVVYLLKSVILPSTDQPGGQREPSPRHGRRRSGQQVW